MARGTFRRYVFVMGKSVLARPKRRYLLRSLLVSAAWMLGAFSATRVPDANPPKSAAELVAPAPAPQIERSTDTPQGSRPGEAPPLVDPPAPAPA